MNVAAALAALKGNKSFPLVLLDPPREGLGADNCHRLAALDPKRIVYISCDPMTLAADLGALASNGYRLTAVYPFDMFPQTFHVEACAVMEK
jgi:23S rRNA (uracil1939-C5)-methyltransferase